MIEHSVRNTKDSRNLYSMTTTVATRGRMMPILALAALLAACGSDAPQTPELETRKIVLTGSSTVAPLLGEIAKRYESTHPEVRIDVQTGGSSRGIADSRSGVADLGMSSRSLKPDEAFDLEEHAVAFDGVAFGVHASNGVTELDDIQLLGIYRGEIEDWSEVGGEPGPITVIHRADGRSEVDLVTEYFGIESREIQADLISGENQHALKSVAGDPGAIVYVSVGAAEREAAAGAPIRLLPLRGVPATAEEVAAGRFPLARPLVLLTRPNPDEAAAAFLEYALSSEVDDLIASLAYVPPSR